MNRLTSGRGNVRYADGRHTHHLSRNDRVGTLQDENRSCDNTTGRHPLLQAERKGGKVCHYSMCRHVL